MYDINNMIPQKPPMRLVDKIIGFKDETVHSQATITPTHIFFWNETKSIPHWVAIEIMAQTAAAYGKLKTEDYDAEASIGFLLSVRNYTTNVDSYSESSILDVYTECIILDSGTGVFKCKIEVDGKTTATVNINAHQPQNKDDAKKILTRSI
jgi:predicted hotdog family 3-hydroxylacyl-ACP dehydratase